MTFEKCELIGVPCEIGPGCFPHERMISVETESGNLLGFVKRTDLETSDEERGYIRGSVVDTSSDSLTVRLFGEFFNSAMGIVSVRRDGLIHLAA